ncbi:hypothetical protein EIP91_007332 [Steccherinum ochraceum]|uniref:DUF6589 domain-containing protein n=1 Tax=Steccherinum ochraceum TaxID=92696 RepID=A0A4R0RXA0_9APHY|nr:hypothetical protein EIP91_007332 [Steccherinum ochraceum]
MPTDPQEQPLPDPWTFDDDFDPNVLDEFPDDELFDDAPQGDPDSLDADDDLVDDALPSFSSSESNPYRNSTRKYRQYRPHTIPSRVLEVMRFMKRKKIDLPILLWAISWNVPSLVHHTAVKYERTKLMVSRELPEILATWYRPPRRHTKGIRTVAARHAMEASALNIVSDLVDRDMHSLRSEFSFPQKDLSEATLLAIDWGSLINSAKLLAPTTWQLFSHCAYTPAQATENTYKTPDSTVLMAIAMCSFSRSHHSCKIPKLLTVFFKACGLSTKAFDTLNALGITLSQKSSYRTIRTIASQADRAMLADIKRYPCFASHDNLNRSNKVFEKRVDNVSTFDSGTCGSVIVIKDPYAVPINPDHFHEFRAMGARTPLTSCEILKLSGKYAASHFRFAVYQVLQYLIEAPAFSFSSYDHRDDIVFTRPPPIHQLRARPELATCQYMLQTLHVEEASYAGNDRVIQKYLSQMGWRTDEQLRHLAEMKVIPWCGDQLTVARIRGLKGFRAHDFNRVQRYDFIEEIIGFFHAQIALMHSLHSQYYGSRSSDSSLVKITDLLNRKGLHKPTVKGAFAHDFKDLLAHITIARFRTLWCIVGEVDKLEDLRKRSPSELLQLAQQIVQNHASTHALNTLQKQSDARRDHVHEQAVQFNRDMLYFFSLDKAIKSGDVGRIEALLPHMLFRYSGGRNSHYSTEMLEILQKFQHDYDSTTHDFVRDYCWLTNTTGRPNAFLPIDELQEHNVKDTKVTFGVCGPNGTWEYVGDISGSIPCQRKIKDHVTAEINHYARGKSHTSPSAEADICRIQESLAASKILRQVPGREFKDENDKAADYIANGSDIKKLQTTIDNWWSTRANVRATTEEWESVDGEDEASVST